jgi:UDP-N-acetylmuramate--alanine ligase
MHNKHRVHFIGIGGIGMSALARWYLAQKWAVSGSDVEKGPLGAELQKEGVKLKIGRQMSTNIPPRTGIVIHTQAVTALNPELRAAKRRGIPALSYPKAVAGAVAGKKLIAICGSHGKSTTTALTGLILKKAGLNPSVIVGTKLKEFKGRNFLNGSGEYFVLEADEYGRSFHHYSPTFVICTNVDAEHLDTYKNLTGVKNGFLKFFSRVARGGTLVLNRDDINLSSLAQRIKKQAKANGVRVVWYSQKMKIANRVKKLMRIPGAHNVSNALGALTLARVLRIANRASLQAIGAYRGSWRRFEYRGEFSPASLPATCKPPEATIYDDYGHHPSEIRATLKGFKEKFPGTRVICVFQPHQAKRLKALFNEFRGAFEDADTALIMPIYKVAGREFFPRKSASSPRKSAVIDEDDDRWDSAALVRAMQKKYPGRPIFYLSNPLHLKSALTMLLTSSPDDKCEMANGKRRAISMKSPNLKASAEGGSASGGQSSKLKAIIVMMGAGNIFEYTSGLLQK